jgi:hypothetical protein
VASIWTGRGSCFVETRLTLKAERSTPRKLRNGPRTEGMTTLKLALRQDPTSMRPLRSCSLGW